MGFNVADTVTGRAIGYGQPVVGFVVQHRFDEPRLKDDPLNSAIRPTDYFALESLPIFGNYEDSGLMEVEDESQMAVQLLLRMTGCLNWEDFKERALNRREGILLPSRYGPGTKRHFGLSLMHLSTYQYLLGGRAVLARGEASDGFEGEQREPVDKASDIRAIVQLLDRALAAPERIALTARTEEAAPPSAEAFRLATEWTRVCELSGYHELHALKGIDVWALPPLRSALDTYSNATFGNDFKHVLRDTGLLGWNLMSSGVRSCEDVPEIPELLGLLWDCQQIGNNMYDVHAIFRPSGYAGGDVNNIASIELAKMTVEAGWTAFVDRLVDCDDDAAEEKMNGEIEKMEALVARMKAVRDEGLARYNEE